MKTGWTAARDPVVSARAWKSAEKTTWLSVVLIFAGLAVSLFSAAPSGGRDQVPGLWWAPTLAILGGAGVTLVLTGLRRPHGLARAASLAAAAAVGNALTAALVKSAMAILSEEGAAGFFLAWQTYGFVLAGTLSVFLLGYAMQAGPLIASQPALTLGDAVVSFFLGVTLYGESPRHGPWVAPALLGVALFSYGVFALSRTRCIAQPGTPADVNGRSSGTRPGYTGKADILAGIG
ncbi:hypothetical protein [Streptomyces sp. NPDC001292]|uniref:hypothetical protein n=1 Tax=Streptomyces sp. NPDC001292 TaxID=3364558 RepID=UPI003699D692